MSAQEILGSGESQDAKIVKLKDLLHSLIAEGNVAAVSEFLTTVLHADVGVMICRPVIGAFTGSLEEAVAEKISGNAAEAMAKYAKISIQQVKNIAMNSGEQIATRQHEFEPELMSIRMVLADLYENEGEWEKSIRELQKIPLDSGHLKIDDDTRFDVYIRIAKLYLTINESVQADTYINRAAHIEHNLKADETGEKRLDFGGLKVSIADFKFKFLDAAQGYYNLLSLSPLKDDMFRLEALKHATICTILAPAGPRRTRMLGILFKDERSKKLSTFSILEATYKEQIIKPSLKQEFESLLPEHVTAFQEYSLLDRAIEMNNLFAASKVYNNITFDELGGLLGISGSQAEETAASMIAKGQMNGHIDQIDRVVFFDSSDDSGKSRSDRQIHDACMQVNDIVGMLEKYHPEWFETHSISS